MNEAMRVALTFDAEHPDRPWCPPDNAERVLDTLRAAGVPATFFVQGRWAEAYPATARRIATEEHLVGFHSHYHARMPLLLDGGFESDIVEGQRAVIETTGVDPRPWFRCPFGDGNDDERVRAELGRLGYRNVHWHVVLEDWEPWRTGPAIAADGIRGVRRHGDGVVVLLHTWPGGTGEGLPALVQGIRDAGGSFVTVDQLEELP